MGRPAAKEEDRVIETWEATIEGTVWVDVYSRREDKYVKQRVGGREGSKRIHISRDDRKYNQERVPDECRGLDPFTNGALRLIDSANRDENLDTRYHLTAAELGELFDIRDEDLFREAVTVIESELVIRRLAAMSEKQGTNAQSQILRDLCEQRYPIGGTQRTVREMLEAADTIGAQRIY